jgi:tRNA dimethylallyltransferase
MNNTFAQSDEVGESGYKNKLLVIIGPTGTGKTDLAISLAKKYNGEIISADSRQLYKDMDIATGKEVTELRSGKAEKKDGYWSVKGVKIHLYDLLDPKETYSVAQYQQKALEIIRSLQDTGKLPILVGGTGLYIQAVTEGLKIPKTAPDLKLRKELEASSPEELYKKLQAVDPKTAERIDENNPHRLVRALEVYELTGQSISDLQDKYKVDFDLLMIGLTGSRERLYENADKSVAEWVEQGLAEETKNLLEKGLDPKLPAMTALGYRQITMSLEKKISMGEAIQRIKFDLHGYIRRQLTWFKRDGRIQWFDIEDQEFENEVTKLVEGWYNRS